MNQIHVPYREAYSDASTLQKNVITHEYYIFIYALNILVKF